MATTAQDKRLAVEQAVELDNIAISARKGGSWAPLLIGMGVVLAATAFWSTWDKLFAFSKGIDATTPEFSRYWMTLLFANLTIIPLGGLIWYSWIAKGCKHCKAQQAQYGAVTAQHEMGHIWRLWALLGIYLLAIFVGGSFKAEQDATWHQVATRDTAFTPSHINLFFGAFPLFIMLAVGAYLYARDRLPHLFRDKGFPVSWALVLTGSFFLLIWVAMNEWFHSFFFTEEIFSAPLHWGFNLFAYLLAGTFAVWFATGPRMWELADKEAAQDEKEGTLTEQIPAAYPVHWKRWWAPQ